MSGVGGAPAALDASRGPVTDGRGRRLRDLRISVTDRCNFRCVYCMPKHIFGRDFTFIPRDELLTFEEITRLARICVAHGVHKIRLTGGEPLLRKGLEELVGMLTALTTPDGHNVDIALTTNGSALALKAQSLKDAGLKRVTVSLDSLDDATFKAVKINMVVKRGQNDHDILTMARHFKNTPHILRFIEYMDVGTSNGWQMDQVVPSAEVITRINAELPLEQIAPNYTGETSTRWRYRDGTAEIGVISSVTASFCHTCTRARISTEGKLFTCLFATTGHDLRALIRNGCTDQQLTGALAHIWAERTDNYSQLRSAQNTEPTATGKKKIEMSYIGG